MIPGSEGEVEGERCCLSRSALRFDIPHGLKLSDDKKDAQVFERTCEIRRTVTCSYVNFDKAATRPSGVPLTALKSKPRTDTVKNERIRGT
jgi:hypothetical protein